MMGGEVLMSLAGTGGNGDPRKQGALEDLSNLSRFTWGMQLIRFMVMNIYCEMFIPCTVLF